MEGAKLQSAPAHAEEPAPAQGGNGPSGSGSVQDPSHFAFTPFMPDAVPTLQAPMAASVPAHAPPLEHAPERAAPADDDVIDQSRHVAPTRDENRGLGPLRGPEPEKDMDMESDGHGEIPS